MTHILKLTLQYPSYVRCHSWSKILRQVQIRLVYMLWILAIPTRIYELFLVVSEETGLKIDLFCPVENI